jgi:ABC-type transporter Mla subunit MlaD
MFFRKGRAGRARDAVADQVADRTDDLATALEAAREAIAKASTAAGRKGTALGKEAAVKGGKARRRGARAAREVADVLPEPEQVAELTRRAADKLFPERAKQRRAAGRRRRRRLLFGGAGLLSAGVVAGWLTAPKRGADTRQALKEQAAKASEKGWERVAEPSEPASTVTPAGEQGAEVTPLHHGDGVAPKPTRTPPS